MSDLKPCPFCNKRPKRKPEYLTSGKVYITCENEACPVNPTTFASEDEGSVWEAWNTRAAPREYAALMEAASQARLALAGMVSPRPATDMLDAALGELHDITPETET